MAGRVFIPYTSGRKDGSIQPQLDMSDAERYGELVVVTNHNLYPDSAGEEMPRLIRTAGRVMKDFDPKRDYLCLVGSPLHIAASVFALSVIHRSFKVLRWDNKHYAYYAIELDARALV